MSVKKGVIVNVVSFSHPHIDSLFKEGLWGFPEDRQGVNRKRWSLLERNMPILFYGEYKGVRGIFIKASLIGKEENYKPVKYWVKNPTGYPLHIYVKIESNMRLEDATPIKKEELSSYYGIPIFKQKADRWSLVIFEEESKRAEYSMKKFLNILTEFEIRNKRVIIEKPDHESIKEILYQMGIMQKKISEKEVLLDNYRIDVAWKKVPRGNPYIVFEVHISGNLEEALTKLKHAYDIWNSQPLILVTTEENIEKAKNIIEGSFHEVKDKIKIIEWKRVKEAYELKTEYKKLEAELGIL